MPEALASGLGVVAFDAAAAGELIGDGHDGWLATPGDAAAEASDPAAEPRGALAAHSSSASPHSAARRRCPTAPGVRSLSNTSKSWLEVKPGRSATAEVDIAMHPRRSPERERSATGKR